MDRVLSPGSTETLNSASNRERHTMSLFPVGEIEGSTRRGHLVRQERGAHVVNTVWNE